MSTFSRISLPVKAVRKALSIIKALVWTKHHNKNLTTVQVERGRGGTWICASDLEMTARIRVNDEWTRETDRLNVEHKRLTDAIKSTKAEIAHIGVDDERVQVEMNGANVFLESFPPSEYPEVARFDATSWRCFAADDFVQAIERVAPYCDVESTRYALGSILLESMGDSKTRFVATDGRRLGFADTENWRGSVTNSDSPRTDSLEPADKQSPCLPLAAALLAKECAKAAPKNSRVDIAWTSGNDGFAIRIEDFAEITSRNMANRFPDYRAILSEVEHSVDHTFWEVDASEFLDVVKAAKSTLSEEQRGLSILAIPEGDGDRGLYVVTPGYTDRQRWTWVTGPMVDISLDADYLRQTLETVIKTSGKSKTAGVTFRVKSRRDAVVLTIGNRHTVVIMPLSPEESPEESKRALSVSGQKIYNALHGIPEPVKATEPQRGPNALECPSVVASIAPEPIAEPEPVAAAVVATEPEPVISEPAESNEEFERRMRRESRALIRSDRQGYETEIRHARHRLETKRSIRHDEQWNSMRDDIYRLRRQGKAFDHDEPERAECLADIRKLRNRWINLPVNRIRVREQSERAEIRHRDKLALFGRQTPEERPYDGPVPVVAVEPPSEVLQAEPAVTPSPEFSGITLVDRHVRTVRRTGESRVYIRSWNGWFPHNPDADGFYVRDNSGPMTTLEVSQEIQAGNMAPCHDVHISRPGKAVETTVDDVPTIDPAALVTFMMVVLFQPEPRELWAVSTVDCQDGPTLLFSAGKSSAAAKAEERARRLAFDRGLSRLANRVRKPIPPRPRFSDPTPRPEFSGLSIGVKGQAYGLEILAAGVFRLLAPNGNVYDVSPCSDPSAANQGYACDCQDHIQRHAGNPSRGCKHANALREVGLISAHKPEPGPDGTPEVPYIPLPEFSGAAAVETLPPVSGGSGEDMVAVHPWQEKGLGMAPFRFRTIIEHPSKALQEANPDAYNYAAGIGAQQRKALGLEDTCTCHACYRDITVAYVIESADGKRFVVGCECVLKTDDSKLITRVEAAKRERNRKASRKRSELKREERRIQAEADAKVAAEINAPIIAALEQHSSGWAHQAVADLRRKPASKFTDRFLEVVESMFCEVTGQSPESFRTLVK